MDHLLVKKEPERERISRSKNRRKEANCTRKKGSKYLVSSNADVDCGDISTPTFGTNLSLTPTRREKKFDGEDVSTERIGRRKNRNV